VTQDSLSVSNDDCKSNSAVCISVFFPCHNEQDNVADTAKKAVDVLEKIGADYEVIIVDDGSSDRTGQIAEKLASVNNRIKVVHHPTNLGYGAALQSGFKAAGKELVFYTDGDGQFDINEMPALLELMGEYDIVSCYRLNRQDSLVRKINGWAWSKLTGLVFGLKIRDIDCAFKLYKRRIFDDIELVTTGAVIDTEILVRAVNQGYKVVQKGVHHYPRTAGRQSGANFKVIFRAFREMLWLWRQVRGSN